MTTDNIKYAVAAIIFAAFVLSFSDALLKHFSVDSSLWQIYTMRSALALPVLWMMMNTARVAGVFSTDDARVIVSARPRNAGWTVLRSLLFASMLIAFQGSLPHLPLSTAAAGLYTLPLFVTLFAALFIGEAVRIRGWLAVSIGFVGMLLILRPRADTFNAYALLPLLSAMLYALTMIITRTRCANEHPLALTFHTLLAYLTIGVFMVLLLTWLSPPPDANPFLLTAWRTPGLYTWGMMTIFAAAILAGITCVAIAYQRAPPPVIATFDFTYLPFAALWGFVFFEEIPDLRTIAGMLLITAAGILALHRNRTPRANSSTP